MTKSIRALHSAHFLLSDAKHLSAHVWQNLQCPQGTKTTLARSALQQTSRMLSVLEAGWALISDIEVEEVLGSSKNHQCRNLQFPRRRHSQAAVTINLMNVTLSLKWLRSNRKSNELLYSPLCALSNSVMYLCRRELIVRTILPALSLHALLKVVWKSWGLPLTSYPFPLSPPSPSHFPLSWGLS